MNNKFVWLAAGIVLTYFFMKSKNKKEVMAKVDKAIEGTTKSIHEDFNRALDAAIQRGYGLLEFKKDINTPVA